ncbi:NlpC/P60 family protein [Tissierella sp. MB52-C2]|uniref:NlpC/P60 family protein n=1 Tax=Tissierella sp. MB52-C2 TaxID=3070999 RepID=UPI00280A6C92|nr:NlpC/P60 family protein [Tissierella sp. MB52-C2]WMM24535.1 NlpC/P60 family protein [Tissierella sp. MB52-C2]
MISRLKRFWLMLILTVMVVAIIPKNTYANLELSQNKGGIPSNWARLEIEKAKERDILPEKIQGDYRGNITREEFTELAVRLYQVLSKKEIGLQGESPFIDTKNPYITMANKLGIIDGKGDGTFGSNENVTREEVSVILYRTLQTAKPRYDYSNSNDYEFNDYNKISSWARQAINYLYGAEIINGVAEQEFDPQGYTSREQAIAFAMRAYDKVIASDRASRNGITISRGGTSRQLNSQENDSSAKIKNIISQQMGKPYVWGAVGPNSFDCSGLTQYIFGRLGITIPRTSREQITAGTQVAKKDLKYGDLVLFARDGRNINHVGIYVGDGNFVHAPQSGDVVKITTLASGYYASSYYTARRVLP